MSQLTGEMKRLARYMVQYKNGMLRPYGINHRDGEIILFLTRCPEKGQDDIARLLLLNKSGVARHMVTMEERGLVVRTTNPADRRELILNLTPKAQELAPVVREVNDRWSTLITETMSQEDKARVLQLLIQMRENAEAYFEEASGR